MTLIIPEDIARSVEEQARAAGTTAEALLIRALHAHFPPVPAELRAELDAWERASDEDVARLNAQEGLN